jgi:hypothetical protein
MNVLVKIHPTRFAFAMSLVVIIAWILYYFVDVKLTNYNTKPVKEQLGQIVEVMKRHMIFIDIAQPIPPIAIAAVYSIVVTPTTFVAYVGNIGSKADIEALVVLVVQYQCYFYLK